MSNDYHKKLHTLEIAKRLSVKLKFDFSAIQREIEQLKQQCPHILSDGKSAVTQDGKCLMCMKILGYVPVLS